MKAIRISSITKLNTRKLRSRLNHRATMLVLFLLANVAVSFGRAGVIIENDGSLIRTPDDFNLNRFSGLLIDGEVNNKNEGAVVSNQNQNKKSVVGIAKQLVSETTNNLAEDINNADSSAVINLIKIKSDDNAGSNFNEIYSDLLRKLRRALLHRKILATTVPTISSISQTTSTSTLDTVTASKLKLKLKNYFENFMHISLAENLQKLLSLVTKDEKEEPAEGTGKHASEKNVKIKANQNNSKTQHDFVPLPNSVPELSESASGNKLKARKLGINIPLIRVKVDDKVLFQGKAEVK